MAHPDEAVKSVHEEPSRLIAEAKLRHDLAKSDDATEQEKKQAAVEQAHALATRPDGSYAQLHETEEPTLAVADSGDVKQLKAEHAEAVEQRDGTGDDSPTAKKAASK